MEINARLKDKEIDMFLVMEIRTGKMIILKLVDMILFTIVGNRVREREGEYLLELRKIFLERD